MCNILFKFWWMRILVGSETVQALSDSAASWPGVFGLYPASSRWAEKWKGRVEVGWQLAKWEDAGLAHCLASFSQSPGWHIIGHGAPELSSWSPESYKCRTGRMTLQIPSAPSGSAARHETCSAYKLVGGCRSPGILSTLSDIFSRDPSPLPCWAHQFCT